jgi:DNA-binding response OmpR family regulator
MAKIVVIDDEKPILLILKEYFETLPDFEVSYFNSSKDASKHLLQEKCDLLITDFRMPELKGSEVVGIVRETEHNKNIPILFVSSFLDEVEKECADFTNIFYMSKPLIFGQFEEIIQKALGNNQ